MSELVEISRKLAQRVRRLRFAAPVDCVYNPLIYARKPHELYLRRYGHKGVPVVLLGMNPGPYGMTQTGVPFGEVDSVRDWLELEAPVDRPRIQHPKRPIDGFSCSRSEVSGRRLWGWARERYQRPQKFFSRFFVYNYCPLVFLEDSGRNRTPDKLPARERELLFSACDKALLEMVELLGPKMVVGVGAFAQAMAQKALDGCDVKIGRILHPSPANPQANKNWAQQAQLELQALGIDL